MSLFEVGVVFALIISICLLVTILILVGKRVDLSPKFDALDTRLSDNMAIVSLAVSGVRDDLNKNSSMLRAEVATLTTGLGANIQTTLLGIGKQTGERIDVLSGDQTRRLDSFASTLVVHRTAQGDEAKSLRDEVQGSLIALGKRVAENLEIAGVKQAEALSLTTQAVRDLSAANEKKSDVLRETVEGRLERIRTENAHKLEEMRVTVDEKLQGTLEKRLGASFSLVNENLERVFKSVGEMQALAAGVGDLKRVLSNVKIRGSWGEGTLGSLLEQMLTPEQYAQNVEVKPGSGQRVEYALKLPGSGDDPLWVPIDSKMPKEDYERLVQASEIGDKAGVEEAGKALERRVMEQAKDISSKYICPPHTSDFAVLFLPTEGLFAEVVRRPGLVDQLQSLHRVTITGPTTLMAYLQALRMGFRSLAIQERSSEVWQVLSAVKTEFGKFGPVLDKVQRKLGEAQNAIEDANKRKRVLDRKLREVEVIPDTAAKDLLAITVSDLAGDEEVDENIE